MTGIRKVEATPSRGEIEAAIKVAEHRLFGMDDFDDRHRAVIDTLVSAARALVARPSPSLDEETSGTSSGSANRNPSANYSDTEQVRDLTPNEERLIHRALINSSEHVADIGGDVVERAARIILENMNDIDGDEADWIAMGEDLENGVRAIIKSGLLAPAPSPSAGDALHGSGENSPSTLSATPVLGNEER